MKGPKHVPVYLNFAREIRAKSSMQCVWINGPVQCLWGTFLVKPAANEDKA